jgi:hypothetical protein
MYEWLDKMENDAQFLVRAETWKEELFGEQTLALLRCYLAQRQAKGRRWTKFNPGSIY